MLAHRHLNVLLSLILALGGLLLLLLGIASAAGITAQEAPLKQNGIAYEVNPDDRGDLWISDDGAGEIWQVNPSTGAYTVYQGMSHASDARMDAAGSVWWSDASQNNKLGRISLSAGTVTTWTLTATGSTWGIAFDAGYVWTTDFVDGVVFRFTPGSGNTGELCAYAMPGSGTSDYIAARGGAVWLGDNLNSRIVKLNAAANEFTYWQLSADAVPEGLALAENGDLWWADAAGKVGRLEPGSSRVTAYTLPDDTVPIMVAVDRGQVWYTSSISGTVGVLDPGRAAGTSSVVDPATDPVTPDCRNLGAGITSAVSTRSGTLQWTPNTYEPVVNGGGLTVYQLPEGAYPWGVTASAGNLWVVDQGRYKLIRVPLTSSVFLPYVTRQ